MPTIGARRTQDQSLCDLPPRPATALCKETQSRAESLAQQRRRPRPIPSASSQNRPLATPSFLPPRLCPSSATKTSRTGHGDFAIYHRQHWPSADGELIRCPQLHHTRGPKSLCSDLDGSRVFASRRGTLDPPQTPKPPARMPKTPPQRHNYAAATNTGGDRSTKLTPHAARSFETPFPPRLSAVSKISAMSSGRHTTTRYQSARLISPISSPPTSARATTSSVSFADRPRANSRSFQRFSRGASASRRSRDQIIWRRPFDTCSHSCQIRHSPGAVTLSTSPVSVSMTAQSPSLAGTTDQCRGVRTPNPRASTDAARSANTSNGVRFRSVRALLLTEPADTSVPTLAAMSYVDFVRYRPM